MSLAIIGATGAVGQEVIAVLEKRNFPLTSLRCFASPASLGKRIVFRGESIPVEVLSEEGFVGLDIAIFCAGRKISAEFAPLAQKRGTLVIDNSSAFRMCEEVPLVIPEVNPEALAHHRGIIASPNCSTTILLVVLAPLHRICPIQRIFAATYQAASGAGALAMQELQEETRALLEGRPFERRVVPHPYAFNLFLHPSPLNEWGYVEEEIKMIEESRKILGDQNLCINASCVRVPVLRAHSEALNVTFQRPFSREEAYAILRDAPGVCLLEDPFPMPIIASGQDAIFCGRIREDRSLPNTLDFWVVGDQLLKGAALNVVQIAELCIQNQQLSYSK